MKVNSKFLKGFTLVEVILYVAIVAIFITAMVSFAWDAIYGRVKSFTHQEVNQNIRLASKRILFEVRNATGINTPAPSASGSTLSLIMADSARNPTVFSVSGERLKVGWGSSGPCPTTAPCNLTSNLVSVTSLTFTNLSQSPSENVKFSITVESTGDRREMQKSETFEGTGEVRSN